MVASPRQALTTLAAGDLASARAGETAPATTTMAAFIAHGQRQGAVQVCSNQVVTGDLAPLCDQHHSPMCPSRTLPEAFQGCTGNEFCQRRYHRLIGYYGGLFFASAPEIYCAEHLRQPLYECAFDAKHRLWQYACPVPGCEYVTEWLRTTGYRSSDYQT